mgnify:CR=1 FL=1
MVYNVGEPEYPKEWIVDEGGPKCTAFEEEKTPEPTHRQRCKNTIDLFSK